MPHQNLLVRPDPGNRRYHHFTAQDAGWNYLNFETRLLDNNETFSEDTGENEYCIVLLGGNFKVNSNKGEWETRNGRKNVFSGIAHTLYLSRNTSFTLTAQNDNTDIAICRVATNEDHPPYLKLPEEAAVEFRGGDNANRQINSLLQPGFNCHKIVCVEVYTPSGNWSSYPAHKHDERKVDANGKLLEAELEEIYFYKIDKPNGFAIQQVYTDDRSLDEVIKVHNNEAVLVPKGYHPVVAGHGYNVYYLNFLAGSDQSLANTPDPQQEWIFGTWKGQDPRLPMVTAEMNNTI